jgi:hypothetical protein
MDQLISADCFGGINFHGRCDGRANTLTLILDTGGNVFGGFTPLEWESRVPNAIWDSSNCWKCHDSLKSFLFAMKNPHNIPARKFVLKAEIKQHAIQCNSMRDPHLGGIGVGDTCSANTESSTGLGHTSTDNIGLRRNVAFTGSAYLQVREIEVFEIRD